MFQYINIIGYGYVGGSMGFLCKKRGIKFSIIDTQTKVNLGEENYFNNIENAIKESEKLNEINFYFICVPTPSKRESYACDTSIVESVFDKLSKNCTKKTIIIIKSTVVPGTTRKLYNKNANNNIFLFFCPEFLTERNAENDTLNEDKIIIGSPCIQKNVYIFYMMSKLYDIRENIRFCMYEYAEMMKYTINCYLAQKVAFFNDIYESCEKLGIEYDTLKDLVLLDKRISPSHTSVPGPDGKFGFGGSCLIKEMKGMIYFRRKNMLQDEHLVNILELNTKRRGKGDDIMNIIYSILCKHMSIHGDVVTINIEENYDDFIEKNQWSFYFDNIEKLYRIVRNDVIYELHEIEQCSNKLYFKDSDLNTISLRAMQYSKDSELNTTGPHAIKTDNFEFYIHVESSLGFEFIY